MSNFIPPSGGFVPKKPVPNALWNGYFVYDSADLLSQILASPSARSYNRRISGFGYRLRPNSPFGRTSDMLEPLVAMPSNIYFKERNTNKPILLPLCILVLSAHSSAINYKIQDRDTRIHNYLDKQIKNNNSPGIQYIVFSPDSEIFRFNGGLADIDNNRPIGAHTTMMIYSMSKTITALAILQLIENGKIALADPAIKYLPDIPYGDQVTIRHLLSQTSGIPNPIPLKWVHLGVTEKQLIQFDS